MVTRNRLGYLSWPERERRRTEDVNLAPDLQPDRAVAPCLREREFSLVVGGGVFEDEVVPLGNERVLLDGLANLYLDEGIRFLLIGYRAVVLGQGEDVGSRQHLHGALRGVL